MVTSLGACRLARFGVLLLPLTILLPIAQSRSKTDVLIMKNGDRINHASDPIEGGDRVKSQGGGVSHVGADPPDWAGEICHQSRYGRKGCGSSAAGENARP